MLPHFFAPNNLTRPLARMAHGRWDLTAPLPQPRLGPLRPLALAFNALLERLLGIVSRMAVASVGLGKVAPSLSSLAEQLHVGSQDQARRAREISQAAQHLEEMAGRISRSSQDAAGVGARVAHTTHALHEGSRNIGEIMSLIGRVADQTRLLSLNAAVEAARAGEHGRGFAVVAAEIQRLADQTTGATHRVSDILGSIREQVDQLVLEVGGESDATSGKESANLQGLIRGIAQAGQAQQAAARQVSQEIASVAGTAETYLGQSASLTDLGQTVRQASEELLISLGAFRLPAHEKARQAVERLIAEPELLCMQRGRMEAFMRNAMQRHTFLELLYVTDAQGRQLTANIGGTGFQTAYDESGHGKDWSSRPWFQGAKKESGVYISDIYRSMASNNFCFTISALLRDERGRTLGVLGADVHFEQLLGG